MVISGGSAGGYTTLAALVFHDVFRGGGSYYGVSDIAALARDTHKFESRYLDWLIGPYPHDEALYRERSPLYHAERLSRPVIFFQGDEDAVVPPNQTEAMVEALRRRGTPVSYFLFSGEQHGFRSAANIQRALDAELYFYAVEVFKTGLTF
jgi:dipeptidyl aminopeptidase/acylaminoacyl peptidase